MAEQERACERLMAEEEEEKTVNEEEEEEDVDGGVDSNDSEESSEDYDDDDDDAIINHDSDSDWELMDGTKVDREVWQRYYKEWDDSGGFDISFYPGASDNHSLVPLWGSMAVPETKQEYMDLCRIAIEKFNSDNAKNYVLVDVVNANATFAAGVYYYFTFEATDSEDFDAKRTFQALVWEGVDEIVDVEFCRFKKFLSIQGDEGSHQPIAEEGPRQPSAEEGSGQSSAEVGSRQSSAEESLANL